MLVLTQGTNSNIVVTLNDSKTLATPYYLFVFTHITTNDIVKVIYPSGADLSDYPERFNEFAVEVVTLFTNMPCGQWYYDVYEQESSTNLVTTGLNMVECGKMKLNPSTNIIQNGYTTQTTIKGYAG